MKLLIAFFIITVISVDIGFSKGGSVKARPAWTVAEAPCRISFIRDADNYILTKVPVNITNQFVSAVEVYSAKDKLPVSVIFNDGQNLNILIDVTGVTKRSRIDLYLIPGEKVAQSAASVMQEVAPLHGVVGRTAGMDYPRTRQEIDSLATRYDRALKTFEITAFDKIGKTYKDWYRGDWRRKSHLVDLNTWVLVPEDGKFIFGLAGVSPAWLKVDSKDMLEHPVYQPFDGWTVTDAFELKAGLHQVEVRTLCRQKIDTGVAWKREGEEGVAADVKMITGVNMSEGRMESSDRNVQPFCTVTSGEAYRFAGVDTSFVPFDFKSRSVCWSGSYNLFWNVADKVVGSEKQFKQTVASVNLPAKLSLTMTADENGESAQHIASIDYNGPVWSEYAISSRMTGLEAACYGNDKIHPIVRVKTSAKDGLEYTLKSEVELVSGRKILRSDKMITNQGWGRQYLTEMIAGNVKQISWSLEHCGCELSSGKVSFQQDPISIVPDGISGELFKKGDDFVVLVVSRRSAEREVLASPEHIAAENVLVMDGFIYDGLSNSQLSLKDQGDYGWQWQSLSELERSSQRSGKSMLQSFTKINDALKADAVVYAPSLGCISQEGGVEGFERRLAAMCGLLTHSAEGSPRVILVVPPRYEELSADVVSDKTTLDSRQVAEIVVRVADVYGVETVDLYTAFEIAKNTAADGSPLVESGEITLAGCALARDVIKRKL
ncbi:MAG: hypothetical protein PF904_01865 [Kiritimatiellae bacterium]|nr:hypothetical protein [Kiritimatiellia bacterium]